MGAPVIDFSIIGEIKILLAPRKYDIEKLYRRKNAREADTPFVRRGRGYKRGPQEVVWYSDGMVFRRKRVHRLVPRSESAIHKNRKWNRQRGENSG